MWIIYGELHLRHQAQILHLFMRLPRDWERGIDELDCALDKAVDSANINGFFKNKGLIGI